MIYLIDTNILLRFVDHTDLHYRIARDAVSQLRTNGHQLQATSQNFTEFWRVSTRPTNKNGFGRTPSQADTLLRYVESLFPLLPDSPDIYPEWRQLVVKHNVSGIQVHDARLVASMISHSVTHILTFNTKDFTRYAAEGIVAIDPTPKMG